MAGGGPSPGPGGTETWPTPQLSGSRSSGLFWGSPSVPLRTEGKRYIGYDPLNCLCLLLFSFFL